MIHAKSLIYDYETFDSEGNADGVVRALDDISVDINRGSFVAILGRNGSGKSTLAKQMNALLRPTSGTVWGDGKDTRDDSELWNIRQSAGMVFQNPDNQIVGTVVEEDVGFGPENMGIPTEEIWVRVNKCLKRMGLEPFRYDSPNTLSGGQKQRLSITHYMEEAVEADYIYVMDQGHVVMAGTPVEIFSDIDTIRRYGLEPPQVVQVVDLLNSKGIKLDRSILTTEELIKALCQR